MAVIPVTVGGDTSRILWQSFSLQNMNFNSFIKELGGIFVIQLIIIAYILISGIMECTCMLFTFENGVLLMR